MRKCDKPRLKDAIDERLEETGDNLKSFLEENKMEYKGRPLGYCTLCAFMRGDQIMPDDIMDKMSTALKIPRVVFDECMAYRYNIRQAKKRKHMTVSKDVHNRVEIPTDDLAPWFDRRARLMFGEKVTDEELAKKLDMKCVKSIGEYRRAITMPNHKIMYKISQLFGVTPEFVKERMTEDIDAYFMKMSGMTRREYIKAHTVRHPKGIKIDTPIDNVDSNIVQVGEDFVKPDCGKVHYISSAEMARIRMEHEKHVKYSKDRLLEVIDDNNIVDLLYGNVESSVFMDFINAFSDSGDQKLLRKWTVAIINAAYNKIEREIDNEKKDN